MFALLAVAPLLSLAPPAEAAIKIDPREIMRVSEVRPGMRGIGRTVFQGVKIETFDVTVIGVMPKENLGRPLILVRMSGGPITKRSANIIGGMSGSPVYINGRMVGAVAYGQTFPREPIAMLTPIEDMLEALDPSLPEKPSWASQRRAAPPAPRIEPGEHTLNKPVTINGKSYSRIQIQTDPYRVARAENPRPGTLQMAPVSTPVMVSGVSARGLEQLASVLRPLGADPMSGPGAMNYSKAVTLQPGAAAGASLATGDVDMTAVGTVTYRKGKDILAFGHPFMQMGAVDMPLTTAWVHDVFPSIMRSFKIASPIKMVGSVRQDRPWGIGGRIGQSPEMIPVEVTVRDFGTDRKKTLHAQVVDNRFITPQLIAMVTNEAILRVHPVPGDSTARVHTQISTEQLGTIERSNMYYDAVGIDGASLGDLLQGLGLLAGNPWQQVDVRSVKVSVDIDGARRTAVIERAVIDQEKYEPGDTVNVAVTLRPWEKEPVKRTLSLRIPEYAPNGRVTLRVSGGSGAAMMAAPGGEGAPGGPGMRLGPSPLPPSTSLKQMVRNYLEKERNNQLVARLSLPSFTANVDGQKMHTLPPALLEVMRSPRNSALQIQNDEVKSSEETPWVVSGMAVVSLAIERRTFAEKESPSSGSPVPPTPPSVGGQPPRPAMDESFGDDFVSTPAGARQPAAADTPGKPERPAAPKAEAPKAETPATDAKKPPTPAGAAAAKADAEEDEEDSPKKPDVDSPVKAAGRAPIVWRQTTPEQFDRGRLKGTSIASTGSVTLAPALEKAHSLDATYIWSLLAANGSVYAGTGDRGVLYRIQGQAVTPVLKSTELQILALARDAAGNVYAGTAPHGLIYRVTPDGKSGVFWRSPEEYILSLVVDDQGTVYAGTSPHGRVYKVTPDGKGTLFATVPDPYVISLARSGQDLYAGTGAGAVVFRIAPDGKVSTFYDPATGNTGSLVAAGPNGRIYIGTSPRGMIYSVDSSGRARVLRDKTDAGISGIATDGKGVVWAVAGDSVYRVEDTAGEPVIDKVESATEPRFLAMALDEQGTILLGSATGDVHRMAAQPARRGELESAVRDAGSIARWGRLTWVAKTPAGTRIVLQTRTGNSEEPDSTWNPWSADVAQSGQTVASPPARYFQYRAVLTSDDTAARPVLSEVAVVYMPRNQEPKVTVSAPKGGEVWSKKQTIRWSGTDPDQDTLLYDVYYSRDDGASWVKVNRVVKESPKEKEEAVGTKAAPATLSKPAGEKTDTPAAGAGKPEAAPAAPKPATEKKPAVEGTPAALEVVPKKADAPAPVPAGGALESGDKPQPKATDTPKRKDDSLKETSYSWDTTEVPDGRYLVKIVGSDRLSNPADSHTVERVVGPILIANAAPRLEFAGSGEPVAGAGRTAALAGTAKAGVPIAGVDYRVDEGEWTSTQVEDGIFDGETEAFTITTAALEAGEHTIEVRVVDAAGNHAEVKRKVTIR